MMQIGEAVAIFNLIETEHRSVEDKGEAIKRVLDMETHNGITKESCFKVIRWLWNMVFEEQQGENT